MNLFEWVAVTIIVLASFGFVLKILKMAFEHEAKMAKIKHGAKHDSLLDKNHDNEDKEIFVDYRKN